MKHVLKTPAKINLYLKITGVDTVSGYHFLETLMSPINLFDEIIIEPAKEFIIETKGIKKQVLTENNIVYKIFKSTEKYIGETLPRFNVLLNKKVPVGAGLGGGSSNGAGFLLFLNKYCNLSLNMAQLVEIASEVGSDIPFFLYDSPAIVTGTGNIVKPVKLSQVPGNLLLIYPGISVNTKLAYSLYDKKKLTNHRYMDINPVRKSGSGSLKNWTSKIVNDFEEIVFEQWSELYDMKLSLENFGANKVFMSGSGSSLVSLFDDKKTRDNAEKVFSRKNRLVKSIELLTG